MSMFDIQMRLSSGVQNMEQCLSISYLHYGLLDHRFQLFEQLKGQRPRLELMNTRYRLLYSIKEETQAPLV